MVHPAEKPADRQSLKNLAQFSEPMTNFLVGGTKFIYSIANFGKSWSKIQQFEGKIEIKWHLWVI